MINASAKWQNASLLLPHSRLQSKGTAEACVSWIEKGIEDSLDGDAIDRSRKREAKAPESDERRHFWNSRGAGLTISGYRRGSSITKQDP